MKAMKSVLSSTIAAAVGGDQQTALLLKQYLSTPDPVPQFGDA